MDPFFLILILASRYCVCIAYKNVKTFVQKSYSHGGLKVGTRLKVWPLYLQISNGSPAGSLQKRLSWLAKVA